MEPSINMLFCHKKVHKIHDHSKILLMKAKYELPNEPGFLENPNKTVSENILPVIIYKNKLITDKLKILQLF